MKSPQPSDLLEAILLRDPRYSKEAYLFIHEALGFTVQKLDQTRHISGQELLEGIREYALSEFGPITQRVLSEWGLHECRDFGNLVFNLVNEGLLGKTDEDSIDDFSGGYDFTEAFTHPFLPPKISKPCSTK